MPGSWGGDGFRQHGHTDANDGGTLAPSAAVPLIHCGAILPYGGAAAPAGFLLCDGSAVSRTTYAALFALLGTAYGAGNGSTTFNVPDLRGRSPLGSGTGAGLTARAIGQSGGEESHALNSGEGPTHTHTATVTDPGHSHAAGPNIHPSAGWTGGTPYIQVGDSNPTMYNISVIASATGITVANANSGSGMAHNTLHPYCVTNFIIKT